VTLYDPIWCHMWHPIWAGVNTTLWLSKQASNNASNDYALATSYILLLLILIIIQCCQHICQGHGYQCHADQVYMSMCSRLPSSLCVGAVCSSFCMSSHPERSKYLRSTYQNLSVGLGFWLVGKGRVFELTDVARTAEDMIRFIETYGSHWYSPSLIWNKVQT
jgi:hypothetical protein